MSQCTLQKISAALECGWVVVLGRILFLEMFVISADYLENRFTKHRGTVKWLFSQSAFLMFCGNTRSADSKLRKAFQTLMSHENSCLYQ
jgi:hypothetical protein